MTANYTALKTEVMTDPLGRGYASMTDAQVATDMNTAYIPVPVPVPISQVAIWAAPSIRAALQASANNNSSPVQSICLTILDWLSGLTGPPLDLTATANQTMLAALVVAGVVQQSDATALTVLATTMTTRALSLPDWGIPVQGPDITAVRGS